MKLLIIGGGAAGTEAALEFRKRNREAEITILNADAYSEYSHCGLPHAVSGEVKEPEDLMYHPPEFYEKLVKIDFQNNVHVTNIKPKEKKVITASGDKLEYDKLIIATGTSAFIPPIKGLDAVKHYTLNSMNDAKALKEAAKTAKSAVVIGSGLIGSETAVALKELGLEVTIIELQGHILPAMLDPELAKLVQEKLEVFGINFKLGVSVSEVYETGVVLGEERLDAELIVVATGVRANVELAEKAGLALGESKGIKVGTKMQTSDSNIYAVGDCAEVVNAITKKATLSQLGTTAVRMGRTLGRVLAGADEEFPPVLNSAITDLNAVHVGSAGLLEAQATDAGIEVAVAKYKGHTKPHYMGNAKETQIKLIADKSNGKLIGAQVIGDEGVLARTMFLTLAMQQGMTVLEVARSETPYTPPTNPTLDPVTMAAESLLRRLER